MGHLNSRLQIPLFAMDTNGSSRKHKYIMARRNWCSVNWVPATGDLLFDIRVEKEKGIGSTVGYVYLFFCMCRISDLCIRYAVRTPPPRWTTGWWTLIEYAILAFHPQSPLLSHQRRSLYPVVYLVLDTRSCTRPPLIPTIISAFLLINNNCICWI